MGRKCFDTHEELLKPWHFSGVSSLPKLDFSKQATCAIDYYSDLITEFS
jgi:hypothetical protein